MTTISLVKPFIPSADVLMPALEKVLYSGYIAEGETVYTFEYLFRNYISSIDKVSFFCVWILSSYF